MYDHDSRSASIIHIGLYIDHWCSQSGSTWKSCARGCIACGNRLDTRFGRPIGRYQHFAISKFILSPLALPSCKAYNHLAVTCGLTGGRFRNACSVHAQQKATRWRWSSFGRSRYFSACRTRDCTPSLLWLAQSATESFAEILHKATQPAETNGNRP